jgi:MoaA/NifB/PqqE/SkfB family radical SAM enzyme
MYPTHALVSVISVCNARCIMCNIWEETRVRTLDPETLGRLPESLINVNITGGEPFMASNLPELVRAIHDRSAPRIVISSNGMIPNSVEKHIREIVKFKPDIGVRISIDGLSEMHAHIRGSEGAFEKCMESLDILKKYGVKDLGLAFTMTNDNVEHVERVYDLTRAKGVEFSIAVAQNSEIYFKTASNNGITNGAAKKAQFERLVSRELATWNPKRWYRAFFERGLYDFSQTGERPIACDALGGFFYLDHDANVYPCNVLDRKIGNLRETSFDEIWASAQANRVREEVAQCKACWMVCTASSYLRRHPFVPVPWILGKKLASHAGMPVLR